MTTAACQTASWIRPIVETVRNRGISACETKAKEIGVGFSGNVINLGGGHAAAVRWGWTYNIDAEYGNLLIKDFNTQPIPVADKAFNHAVCEQVIEHPHNTTFFLSEIYRVLRPGANLLLSTENLGSLPNIFALLCGKAPFSTQPLCGHFVGGWKKGPVNPVCRLDPNAPAFSGCRGHVRVMTKGQVRQLLAMAGFEVKACYSFGFNHYILFHAIKP